MERATILVVEDDYDLREGLRIRLGEHYQTMPAEDAWSAIDAIGEHRPDLVLLDLGLAVGTGYTVLDHLRHTPSLADVPVVVVTGRDPRVNRDLSLAMGAAAFVEKPIDNVKLFEAVTRALEASAARGIAWPS